MLTFCSVYILVIVTVFISIIIIFIRSTATLTHIRGLIIEPSHGSVIGNNIISFQIILSYL